MKASRRRQPPEFYKFLTTEVAEVRRENFIRTELGIFDHLSHGFGLGRPSDP